MVALKPPQEMGVGFSISGSRNAVVALKPGSGVGSGAGVGRKQERRGGIETILAGAVWIRLGNEAGTPWWH